MNLKHHVIILNRAALQSVDGWIHVVPKGELPNAEAGIVQVLDDESHDSILAGIQKDKNRLGDKWPGIYAGREHFIYDSGQDSAALAWFKDFEKRPDGIWAKDEGLTDIGQTAVKNRHYKFTSFVADPADLQKVSGKKYRVMKIETVGFTNQANGKELLTPIVNRQNNLADADASAENQQQNNQEKMKTIASKLGLTAEASEEAILAEVTKLLNRGDISAPDLVTLRSEHKTFGDQNKTLMDEQVDGILAEHNITDAKVINRIKPVLTACKNRDDRLATLLDFGFKPGETKTAATRVLNRGTGGAAEQQAANEEQAAQARAVKVMNRANVIMKETPTIGLATATTMASREIQ